MKFRRTFPFLDAVLLTGYQRCLNPTRRMVMNPMKIVRRTHLYAGLFLAPWVAMYGFSGLIFDHGDRFAPGGGAAASKPIEWTADVTALPPWPEPAALARKVVAALNAAGKDKAGAAEYRLSAEGEPTLQGGVSLQGRAAQPPQFGHARPCRHQVRRRGFPRCHRRRPRPQPRRVAHPR